MIVGAPNYDAGELDEGAAFVFLGGADGIGDGDPGTAFAQLESDQADARLGFSVAGAGDVNGDGYADVIVGAPYYDAGQVDEGAAFVFVGSARGIADAGPDTAYAQLESDQADARLGVGVAGAGDVNGDGYGDVIAGAPYYDAGESSEGATFVFLGNGGREGFQVRAQQARGDSSATPVAPWGGSAEEDAFEVEMTATHPAGRGRVKLEIEVCPPEAAFGSPSGASHVGATWIDVTAGTGGVRVAETISSLSAGTLYRWRARLHFASATGAAPITPPHGPWRRLNAQAVEADVRALPEPGGLVSLLAGALLLRLLRPRRRPEPLDSSK